jgi:two-component system sensor histidine kinase CpxA
MAGLVNELLRFSKEGLVAGQAAPAPVEVGELVQRVIAREAAEASVRLTEGAGLRVLAQPDGLFRALSNLVRNAVRYAGADGPIEISARRANGEVLLTVADQGPGLPEDMLDRVFTPFYRPDRSRSRDSGGAGLGLAIVKTCVESSEGTISCRNRHPRGLEVIIRLRGA